MFGLECVCVWVGVCACVNVCLCVCVCVEARSGCMLLRACALCAYALLV